MTGHRVEHGWEISFLTEFYRTHLQASECLDLGSLNRPELLAIAADTASLRKHLVDLADEGYTQLTTPVTEATDALARLGRLSQLAWALIDPEGVEHPVGANPDPTSLNFLDPADFAGGETVELEAYLNELSHKSDRAVDIAPHFRDAREMGRWCERTDALMGEVVAFILWTVKKLRRRPNAVPVPLLRDTLLLHLGLDWLNRNGVAVRAPRPLFIGRKFVKSLLGEETAYSTLSSEILYQILQRGGAGDLTRLRREFAERALGHGAVPATLADACRDYLASLELEGPPLLLETGLHGTFPLWLLSVNGNIGEFLLHSTVPWLRQCYGDIVFRRHCDGLRDLEGMVIHEHLMQFASYGNRQVLVKVTSNRATQDLALYELRRCKELLSRQLINLC